MLGEFNVIFVIKVKTVKLDLMGQSLCVIAVSKILSANLG